jgi:hypothetical protein
VRAREMQRAFLSALCYNTVQKPFDGNALSRLRVHASAVYSVYISERGRVRCNEHFHQTKRANSIYDIYRLPVDCIITF